MFGVLFTIWSVLTTSLDDLIGWFKIVAFFVGLVVVYKFVKKAGNSMATTQKTTVANALGDSNALAQYQQQQQQLAIYKQQRQYKNYSASKSNIIEEQKRTVGARQLWNCSKCKGILDANFSLSRDRSCALCSYCARSSRT